MDVKRRIEVMVTMPKKKSGVRSGSGVGQGSGGGGRGSR